MNQVQAEFLDSDLLKEAESTAQLPSLSSAAQVFGGAGQVRTTRMASIAPPPLPPEGAQVVQLHPGVHGHFQPQTALGEGTTRFVPHVPARPSWLRAILDSTFPPPGGPARDSTRMRRVIGVTSLGIAAVLALVALAVGLAGAPSDPSLAPQVAAALVIARGLFALGVGAFSFGLIRLGERTLQS